MVVAFIRCSVRFEHFSESAFFGFWILFASCTYSFLFWEVGAVSRQFAFILLLSVVAFFFVTLYGRMFLNSLSICKFMRATFGFVCGVAWFVETV